MKLYFYVLFLSVYLSLAGIAKAQCDSINITGDFIQTSSGFLSGTYNVSGTFHIPSSVTMLVEPYSSGGCGELVVYAKNIIVEGNILGDFAGFPGGMGGSGGVAVTSQTGDTVSLYDCSNTGTTGEITVSGGTGGTTGQGSGSGQGGGNGQNGSGPKQDCGSSGDYFGLIGSAGGGGGGGGGSYGGTGTAGGAGGAGTDTHTGAGITASTQYPTVAGNAGNAGASGNSYGTASGSDIAKGSGGGGGGGGGRSYDAGLPGGAGGAGGGMVRLVATDTMIVTGMISVNGENGAKGGDGGPGGTSAKCCSDNCDDCGEVTLSCGAGAGSGAGGGSGGGIWLNSGGYIQIAGVLSAKGGNGGNIGVKGTGASCNYVGGFFCGDNQSITSGDGNNGKAGGGGSGGRIKLFYPDCPENSVMALTDVSGGTGPSSTASSGTFNEIKSGCTVPVSAIDPAGLDFTLFPNPVKDAVNLTWNGEYVDGTFCVQVINSVGQTLIDCHRAVGSEGFTQIDISSLTPGIYYCRMEIEGVAVVKMFAKK